MADDPEVYYRVREEFRKELENRLERHSDDVGKILSKWYGHNEEYKQFVWRELNRVDEQHKKADARMERIEGRVDGLEGTGAWARGWISGVWPIVLFVGGLVGFMIERLIHRMLGP